MKRLTESQFNHALRHVRKARGLTQEDFEHVTSRVYISALERGVKQPTLPKVDALASVLNVHPLTLLALSYCSKLTSQELQQLCDHVMQDFKTMQP